MPSLAEIQKKTMSLKDKTLQMDILMGKKKALDDNKNNIPQDIYLRLLQHIMKDMEKYI